MRCSNCHRPLRLFNRRHPQRLLLPRCRVCHAYTFGLVHKILLYVCAFLALLLWAVLMTRGGL